VGLPAAHDRIDVSGIQLKSIAAPTRALGPGYFFRQQHELLSLAARGDPPAPAPSDRVASVVRSPEALKSKAAF
jgi:hypothetical protein